MKLPSALLVFVSLGLFVPSLHADPTLTVNAGVAGGALVETPILGGETWVYTDTAINVFSVLPPISTIDNNVFTATFTDIAGQALLNVNDLCANVGVLTAANPCSLGFTFTDASLGTPFLDSNAALLGILGADVNANAIGLEVGGASIGGGQAQFGFGNPTPSPTPEPSTLTLLGTGLLGMAGVVRKKLAA
jgi:hypothetical protein